MCCFSVLFFLFGCCLSVCSYVVGVLIHCVGLLCCGSFDSLRCVCFLSVLRIVCQSIIIVCCFVVCLCVLVRWFFVCCLCLLFE